MGRPASSSRSSNRASTRYRLLLTSRRRSPISLRRCRRESRRTSCSDRRTSSKASIGSVEKVLVEAIVVVAIVLFAFLLNVRTTAISLTAVPVSILITTIVFTLAGSPSAP